MLKRFSALKWGLSCAFFVILLDQSTKRWAESVLPFRMEDPMTSFFNFYLAHNAGIAFSLWGHMGVLQRYGLLVFTGLVMLMIMGILKQLQPHEKKMIYGMGLILGGGLSNAWDRLFHGFVIDFLDLHVGRWHWPTFNLADVAITLGVFLLMASSLKSAPPS